MFSFQSLSWVIQSVAAAFDGCTFKFKEFLRFLELMG